MQKSIFEQSGGTYSQVGDYLMPDLVSGETEQRAIGKYGRMRKTYLKEHRPVLFTNQTVTRMLHQHLAENNKASDYLTEVLSLHIVGGL